jgi:hypothetical protein
VKYILLAYADPADPVDGRPPQPPRHGAAEFFQDRMRFQLAGTGELVSLEGLADDAHTRTLWRAPEGVRALDGLTGEGAGSLIGFGIVDCESHDRAIQIAAGVIAGMPGSIAVRPLMDSAGALDV